MNKNEFFLRKWGLLFSILFVIFSVSAQKNQQEYPLGTNQQFLNELELQLDATTKHKLKLQVSDKDILNSLVNFEKRSSGKTIHLEGHIDGDPTGNFSIDIKNNTLDGKIILPKLKKAYLYHSDNKGNAFIKEVDINTVICIDLPKPIIDLKKEKKPDPLGKTKKTENASQLQSLPNAAGCLLLDFDGHTVLAGSGWNGGNPINAAPSGMSYKEILEAWEIVTEDFLPFNLNVTTDENVFNTYPQDKRVRCIITPTDIAYPGGTGFALISSFSSSSESSCWVFTLSAGTYGKIVGEIASHELGHTLGLSHDGQNQYAYYSGNGEWAPIMGMSYYKNVTQWSKAEYTNGTNHQDDLAIISSATNGVGYRVDNHGNTNSTATALHIVENQIHSSQNHGVIVYPGDIDVFSFTTGGGNASLNIQTIKRHSNLLLKVSLYNEQNLLIGTYTGNPNDLSQPITINTNLSPGKHYLSITGKGDGTPDTGYTNYASLGYYDIFGTITNTIILGKPSHLEEISVYPNPVKEELTIKKESDSDVYEIKIYNASGQIVYINTATDRLFKIPFSDKQAGLYLVIIKNITTGEQKTIKITKK